MQECGTILNLSVVHSVVLFLDVIIIGILLINTIVLNARWGVIFGGPIVLGSLAVSVGLRLVSTDGDQDPHTREVVKKVGWRFFAFLIM